MNPELLQKILDALAKEDGAAALDLLKQMLVAETSDDPADAGADPVAAAADPPMPDPSKPQPAANSKELDEIKAELATLRARNAEIELETRRELIAELVKLGVETPATAWQRDVKGKPTGAPVARLSAEPIKDMRERVAVLRASAPRRATPPETTDTGAPEYTPAVKAKLEKMNPAQRARFEQMQANSYAARKGIRQ